MIDLAKGQLKDVRLPWKGPRFFNCVFSNTKDTKIAHRKPTKTLHLRVGFHGRGALPVPAARTPLQRQILES